MFFIKPKYNGNALERQLALLSSAPTKTAMAQGKFSFETLWLNVRLRGRENASISLIARRVSLIRETLRPMSFVL
jgi:hypothetical protein